MDERLGKGGAPQEDALKKILIIEDESAIASAYAEFFGDMGYRVTTAGTGAAARRYLFEQDFSIVISDMLLPDAHGLEIFREVKKSKIEKVSPAWVMITGHATVSNAVEVIKEGVDQYFVKPVDLHELEIFVARCLENYATRLQNWRYKNREKSQGIEDRIIGQSQVFRESLSVAKTAAASEATILIRGESGTGKELIAELIHNLSPRASGPFVKVNCAAIPEPLLEAELFGHEKGAFTDAHRERKGKFELAKGGTIFLDEIGDMSPKLQVKLLRVLQEREVERIGAARPIPLDIRLVAATNRDLESMIASGAFRGDLYYRINVINLDIPPLRDRGRDDVLLLGSAFLAKFNSKNKKLFKTIGEETQLLLARYKWPGNVRELENVIERAVVLGSGTELLPSQLPPLLREQEAVDDDVVERVLELAMPLEELERELLRRALVRANGNVSAAARLLGLSRRTLQYRMEKFKLSRDGPVGSAP